MRYHAHGFHLSCLLEYTEERCGVLWPLGIAEGHKVVEICTPSAEPWKCYEPPALNPANRKNPISHKPLALKAIRTLQSLNFGGRRWPYCPATAAQSTFRRHWGRRTFRRAQQSIPGPGRLDLGFVG